jgi:hypothetical protein
MRIQAFLTAAAVNLKRLATALALIIVALFAPAFASSARIAFAVLRRIGRRSWNMGAA